MDSFSTYQSVAQAIRYLRQHYRQQPSLEGLAEEMEMSSFHLQRLFSRWAGVSPKRFLQFLTVEHAKERLRASEPVLHAAFSAGLSGPGRLHDLLLSTSAVTPGEYKTGGEGLTIRHGVGETPFGPALLGMTDRGLCHLAFLDPGDSDGAEAFHSLEKEWPGATFISDSPGALGTAKLVFSHSGFRATTQGSDAPRPLPLLLKGTNFQIRVWRALLQIPPGALATYGRLASALGNPGAARSVGTAVGRNSIAFLIPCHRIIREEGTLGGYRWDPARKEILLGWEAAKQAS